MRNLLNVLLVIGLIPSLNAQTNSQTEDLYGPVNISFHGFICHRPTNDDPFGGDGVGDEVSIHFWDWTTVSTNRENLNVKSLFNV